MIPRKLKASIQAGLRPFGYCIRSVAHAEASRRAYADALKELNGLWIAHEQSLKDGHEARAALERLTAECEQREREYRGAVSEKTRCAHTPQLAFMHLMKTAGIAVQMFFKPFYDDSSSVWVESSEQVERMHPHYIGYFDLVQGHFSYKDAARLRGNRRLVSIVREPVDRLVSAYWYYRTRKKREVINLTRPAVAYAKRFSFLDWVRSDHPLVRAITHNQQTYAFAHDWRAPREGDDEVVLQSALAHLDEFFFVGLYERLEDSLGVLCGKMGWPRTHTLGRHNVTPRRPSVAELSVAERDAVLERNQLDALLHGRVRQRLEGAWTAPGQAA